MHAPRGSTQLVMRATFLSEYIFSCATAVMARYGGLPPDAPAPLCRPRDEYSNDDRCARSPVKSSLRKLQTDVTAGCWVRVVSRPHVGRSDGRDWLWSGVASWHANIAAGRTHCRSHTGMISNSKRTGLLLSGLPASISLLTLITWPPGTGSPGQCLYQVTCTWPGLNTFVVVVVM